MLLSFYVLSSLIVKVSHRGVIKDEDLNRLCEFIRDSLFEYFSRTPVDEIDPLALTQFYRDYPVQAA